MITWGGQSFLLSESEGSIWELEEEQIKYFDEKYGSASSKMSWQKLCNFIVPGITGLILVLKVMKKAKANEQDLA